MSQLYYTDASFDKNTHVAFIGYCNIFMQGKIMRCKVRDNNRAEELAIELLLKNLTVDPSQPAIIRSDSLQLVEKLNQSGVLPVGVQLEHVPREKNLADAYIRIHKEEFHVNQKYSGGSASSKGKKASHQDS